MSESKQFNDQPNPTEQFISAIQSVENYNNSFTGLGGTMVDMLFALTRFEEEQSVKRRDQEQMEREVVNMLQADDLAEMGIKLFDAQAPGVKEYTPDLEHAGGSPSSLLLLLDDGEKFGGMVSNLDINEDNKAAVDKAVSSVLVNSAGLVSQAYGMPDEDSEQTRRARYIADRQLDMYARLNPILTEKGLGSVWACQSMNEYTVRHEAGTLVDFIKADRLHLLAGPESFGPSKWQTDSTAEMLQSRWQSGVDLLKTLRDKQSPFYTELFNKLRPEFDEAFTDVMSYPKDGGFRDEHREAMEVINNQWEKDFALENSFYLTEHTEQK